MLKTYVRHGLIVDKIHGIFSFTQSKWLEKLKNFYYKKEKFG